MSGRCPRDIHILSIFDPHVEVDRDQKSHMRSLSS